MLIVWGKFLLLLGLVLVFGYRASVSADIIAEKRKWARAFMGVIFLSMITSFPELFTGISAVALVGDTDMALGEILGSCIFNLFIIAVVDIVFRRKDIYRLSRQKINFLSYSFAFLLAGAVTFLISVRFAPVLFGVGVSALVVLFLYLIFLKILWRERQDTATDRSSRYDHKSLGRETAVFIGSSLIIIGVGLYLPVVGAEISRVMHWNSSFVGVVFLAFVTSFPELVVCISAARIGAFDMVFGNISGSNLFNLGILFILDAVYRRGVLLQDVSEGFVPIGIIVMLMTFVVLFAVMRKSRSRIAGLVSINALVLTAFYIINLVLSYR